MNGREALARAVAAAVDGDIDVARVWVAIAAEFRQGTAEGPYGDGPGLPMTLHDVEGIVCAHGRVAIRRRTADQGPVIGTWWLHVDDRSSCDDSDQGNDPLRRRAAPMSGRPPETHPGFPAVSVPLAPRGPLLDAGQRYEDDLAATATDLRVPTYLDALAQTETAAMELPDQERPASCRHCGEWIRFAPSAPSEAAHWFHHVSLQRLCPAVSEGVRTFAEPQQ